MCKWCRCSRSRSCPGLRGVSARWCASSSQAPYRSLSYQCESSFTLLLLLSPKSLVTFRGPHYRALRPDHIQSDGYSVFKVHCARGRCLRTQWAWRKSPLTMFGQRGAKKEVVLRNFFYFFALPCRKPGGFNEAIHLLSHWKGCLWGCLGKIIWFLRASGTPLASVAAIVHSLPREEQVMGWHPSKSKSEVSCGFARSLDLCFRVEIGGMY